MKRQSGLTLLELLVGLAIFSMVITGLYAVLRSGLYTFKEAEERMAYDFEAELTLRRMREELRGATSLKGERFEGKANEMTFITLSNSFDSSLSWLRSLSKVSLSFIPDPNPKIVKTKEALLFEDRIKEEEEFSLSASTLSLLYLNQESEWNNTFTSEDPPKAVKISLGFKDEDFSKTIFIPNWSKEN